MKTARSPPAPRQLPHKPRQMPTCAGVPGAATSSHHPTWHLASTAQRNTRAPENSRLPPQHQQRSRIAGTTESPLPVGMRGQHQACCALSNSPVPTPHNPLRWVLLFSSYRWVN